jgi:hypothetical protein
MWTPNATMCALGQRDGWRCAYCERRLAHLPEHVRESTLVAYDTGEAEVSYFVVDPEMRWPQVDHVVPRSRGGSGVLDNLVLACTDCNRQKWIRPVEEFLLILIGEAREQLPD